MLKTAEGHYTLAGKLLLLLAVGLVAFLFGMVLLRLRNPIGYPPATGLIGALALTFLLTPVVLIVALALRNKALGGAGLVLLLVLGYWASADLRFGAGHGDRPDGAARIATANVYIGNPDPVSLINEILAEDPDIIMLQEMSPRIWALLKTLPQLEEFTFRNVNARDNPDGTVLLSRLPARETGNVPLGSNAATSAEINIDGTWVRVINLHISAPISDGLIARGKTQLRELRTAVDASATPVVIAGDFNATVQHARFQDLMGDNLQDAHQLAGRGFGATWRHHRLDGLPPILRIDHILLTEQLDAIHSWTGDTTGSDHEVLFADVVVVGADS